MNNTTYAYAEITKATRTPDGDVMVEGIAASPSLDLDKQRMSADFLKTAMPEWYKWANIRAQHGPVAAGIGTELTDQGNGTWHLKALIVDEDAKTKVLKKVYKGFSVGIKHALVQKHATAPKGLIIGGEVVEISLVDRPSNGDSKLSICKSAGGGLLVPTDEWGNEIMPETDQTQGTWLTADLHKAATASAQDVLDGDFDHEDADSSRETISELCDLLIHEAMMVKSALAEGEDIIVIDDLRKAADAIELFVDSDVSDFPGGEQGMRAAFEEFLAKGASVNANDRGNLVTAELVKAAVTQATGPYVAELEAMRAEMAEVRKAAKPGGPVVMARTPSPVLNSSPADFLLSESQRPAYAPAIQGLLAEAASNLG